MASTTGLISNESGFICRVCMNLDFHCPEPNLDGKISEENDGLLMTFSREFSEFDKSADQGCSFCWIVTSIGRLWNDKTRLYVHLSADRGPRIRCTKYETAISIYVPKETSSTDNISAFGSIRARPDISKSAWSEPARNFALDCIRRCNQNHGICSLGETLLPTRVIDVGRPNELLRLFETQGSTTGQYIALSYCWGSDQHFKTTCANIQNMKSGISLSQLPQTLVDAVHVTRFLNIQYLWVDTLCIVQDSVEDWERQSEQMSKVYEKAYVVIAASSSASATQGFLNHQREKRAYHLPVPDIYGTQAIIAARSDPQSGFHSVSRRTDPLARRAWAFQEQHMSTRCLSFSTDELQWACKMEFTCECGLSPGGLSHHPLLRDCCDDSCQDDLPSTVLTTQAGKVWHDVVQDYTYRKATYEDDKLPAISGIASRFGARMGLRYVAGIWRENLVDLTWSQDLGGTTIPVDYRAPSFSWASVHGPVRYPYPFQDSAFHWVSFSWICDAGTSVPGRNPFGRVSDAWIKVQGPMLRGSVEDDDFRTILFVSDDGVINIRLSVDSFVTGFHYTEDDKTEKSVRRLNPPEPHERSGERDENARIGKHGVIRVSIHSNLARACVWLLHLGRFGLPGSLPASHDFYLVLGKSPRDPQNYERIGHIRDYEGQLLAMQHSRFTRQTITIL